MCASELEFDVHYKSGEYFILVDRKTMIVNIFDDDEFNRTMDVNWMHKVKARQERLDKHVRNLSKKKKGINDHGK
jgi:hypothetical protein